MEKHRSPADDDRHRKQGQRDSRNGQPSNPAPAKTLEGELSPIQVMRDQIEGLFKDAGMTPVDVKSPEVAETPQLPEVSLHEQKDEVMKKAKTAGAGAGAGAGPASE